MSFRVVRASKFRHVFGKEFKKQDVRTPTPTPPKKTPTPSTVALAVVNAGCKGSLSPINDAVDDAL